MAVVRMVMAGHGPKSAFRALSSAAAVGVTVSPLPAKAQTGTPSSRRSTAGAGTAIRPWAHCTKPSASGSGPQTRRSASRSTNRRQTRQVSRMLSSAPTSWKATLSGAIPWTAPSASASRRKARTAVSFALSGMREASMMVRISASVRCSCSCGRSI